MLRVVLPSQSGYGHVGCCCSSFSHAVFGPRQRSLIGMNDPGTIIAVKTYNKSHWWCDHSSKIAPVCKKKVTSYRQTHLICQTRVHYIERRCYGSFSALFTTSCKYPSSGRKKLSRFALEFSRRLRASLRIFISTYQVVPLLGLERYQARHPIPNTQ